MKYITDYKNSLVKLRHRLRVYATSRRDVNDEISVASGNSNIFVFKIFELDGMSNAKYACLINTDTGILGWIYIANLNMYFAAIDELHK